MVEARERPLRFEALEVKETVRERVEKLETTITYDRTLPLEREDLGVLGD